MKEDFIIPIFIFSVVIIYCIYQYYNSRKAIVKRKLKRSPKTTINLCKNNELVKIVGKVEVIGEILFAPLSSRKCAYYYVMVEEDSGGKNSSYRTIIEKEIRTSFVLRDNENIVLVNPRNLLTHLVIDEKYHSGFFNDATKNLEDFLQKNGYESTGFFGFNKKIRYSEGILEEGELVAVVGKARWSEGHKEGLPMGFKKILVIDPYDTEPVYLSDDPSTLK
jgi:hypothetical protein